jgi:hypothetical protein
MAEMEQAPEEEWSRKLAITFVGEDGVDAGGLSREFFSILFEQSPVFEDNLFSFDSSLLEKKQYYYMGRMVVMGILSGHPGPRNLQKHVVDYIIYGKVNTSDIPDDQIERADALCAMKEVIIRYSVWGHQQTFEYV